MKKTTMTVATFLVAATGAYAVVPANGGTEVTVKAGEKEGTVELSLRRGTYELSVVEKGVTIKTVTSPDGKSTYDNIKNIVIPDKGADIKVTLAFTEDKEKAQTATVIVKPISTESTEWGAYVGEKQNILAASFSQAQGLRVEDGEKFPKRNEVREGLINAGVTLQTQINELGITDYNEFLDNKNTLPTLDAELEKYKKEADGAAANEKQYYKANEAWEAISYKKLEEAYEASEKTPAIKATCKALQDRVKNYKQGLENAYNEGMAAVSYSDAEKEVAELQKRIDDTAKSLASGNENLLAYNAVNDAVEACIKAYNIAVETIYEQIFAIEQNTYDDKYKAALAELNALLKTVNEVKADNQTAYTDGKNNKAKADELIAKLPATDEFVNAVQDNIKEVEVLKKAYDTYTKAITDKKKDVNSWYDAACKDSRTDSKGAAIKTYFTEKRDAIINVLNALQSQLDASNGKHEHENTAKWQTKEVSWTVINAKIVELNKDLFEYNCFAQIQKNVDGINKYWDNADKDALGIKQQVEAMTQDEFVATAHFSDAGIAGEKGALTVYLSKANIYVLGSQYDEDATKRTPCKDFLYGDESTLLSAAYSAMNEYKTDADAAFTNYKTIKTAIAGYTDQIDGKDKVGDVPAIASWSSIVKNENVTVDGEMRSQTYADAKAAQDAIIKKAKEAITKALAIAKDKETEFSNALEGIVTTNKPEVASATDEIVKLKDEYATVEKKWLGKVKEQAAEDAKEEATNKVTALETEIQAITAYKTTEYGTMAAEVLNSALTDIQDKVSAEKAKIKGVPSTPEDAIVYLDTVKKNLDNLRDEKDKLVEKAAGYKTVFAAVLATKNAIVEKINGKKNDKNEVIIASIKELLGTVNKATSTNAGNVKNLFDNKISAENKAIDALWAEIDATGDIAKALPNTKDKEGKEVLGFEARLGNISKDVEALRTHAVNEDNNQKAKNNWDGLIAKYRTLDKVDQSVEAILQAAEVEINKADETTSTDGERYFLNLIQSEDSKNPGYRKQVESHKTTAETNYVVKTKEGYTDTEKNLVRTYETLKGYIDAIVKEVDGLGAKAKTNEQEYAAQTKKLQEVQDLYNEVNVIVNSSESYEGTNYEEAYNKAINDLTALNEKIQAYKKDYTEKYKNGSSQAFDAAASIIDGYGKELGLVKTNWETGDNSYLAAVNADNLLQWNAYKAEWQKLYDYYYGTPEKEGAIDIITKLKGLTEYSTSEKLDADVQAIATGEKSLYTKAAEINKLQEDTQKEYEASTNKIWSNEDRVGDVTALKTEIEKQCNTYADAINKLAKADYEIQKDAADKYIAMVKAGISAILEVDATNEKELDRLMGLATVSNTDKRTVLDIQKKAEKAEEEIDFAHTYVYEVKPELAKVKELCDNTANAAAKEYYAKKYNSINTSSEANQIAGFYYAAYANDATSLDAFEKGGYSAEYSKYIGENGAWSRLTSPESVNYSNYRTKMRELSAQVTTYSVKEGDKDVAYPCTVKFLEAYTSNEQYKANKLNDEKLKAANADIAAAKELAMGYARNLLVEHDSEIDKKFGDIKDITNVNDKAATLNLIEAAKQIVFDKEYVAVGLEIANLVKVQGDPSELSDKLNARNEEIYGNLKYGKKNDKGEFILDDKDQKVKASFEETYKAYLQLEKDIADALAKVTENALADANTAVQTAVEKATVEISNAVTAHENAHRLNKQVFQSRIDNLKEDLKKLNDKIALQGNAIVLEKDNNVKAAENIVASVKNFMTDLKQAEKDYDDNDDFVKEARKNIENVQAKLNTVVEAINALEYVKKLNEPYDGTNMSYTGVIQSNVQASIDGRIINGNKTDGIKDRLNALEGLLDRDKTVGKLIWNDAMKGITDDITECRDYVIQSYNYALYEDAKYASTALTESLAELREYVNDIWMNLETNEKKDFNSRIRVLEAQQSKADNYRMATQTTWIPSDDVVVKETIDGTKIEDGKTVKRADAHKEIKDVFAEINGKITEIRDGIITPGAIGNGKEVTGADINTMVNFILGKSTPKDEKEKHAADVNGNGIFDVADLQAIVNMYLYGNYDGTPKARNSAAPRVRTAGTLAMFANADNLNLTLDTEMAFTGIQLDVTLPEGVILTDAALASDMEGVVVKSNKIGENTWRVLAYSSANGNIIEGLDFLNISLAGKGTGVVSIDNVKGATTRGVLVSIPGAEESMNITTGVNATMAQAKAYIYGVDGKVRESIGKGINIVKDAAGKVKKVVGK